MTQPVVLPIELNTSQLRPVAYRIVSKKHGLNLKSSALDVLARYLGRNFGVEWRTRGESFLDEVAKTWKSQERGIFIDGDTLTEVLTETASSAAAGEVATQNSVSGVSSHTALAKKQLPIDESVHLINTKDLPLFRYSASRHEFEHDTVSAKLTYHQRLLGSARLRVSIFESRYAILYDQLMRQELFQNRSFRTAPNQESFALSLIKSMLGRKDQVFTLFGLLSKRDEDTYLLADPSGTVMLDLSVATTPKSESFFAPGMFIICRGVNEGKLFIVSDLISPTCETRELSRTAFGYIDLLSPMNPDSTIIPRIDLEQESRLIAYEHTLTGSDAKKIVILGANLFFDDLNTVDAIRSVFKRLEVSPPLAILLPGPFMRAPFQPNGSSPIYKESMDYFAQMLEEFPGICNESTLVFLPGDNDPWSAMYTLGATPSWPLEPIPSLFTTRIRRQVKKCLWATNPCRLTVLSQDFVFVGDDYGARFRKHNIRNIGSQLERDVQLQGEEQEELDAMVDDPGVSSQPPVGEEESSIHRGIDDDNDRDQENNVQHLRHILETNSQPVKIQRTPQSSPEIAEARKLVKTLLDQAHLSPFPIVTRPVSWEFDHALFLAPLPQTIFLVDPTTCSFHLTYQECRVNNPGVFLRSSKANWMEYDIGTQETKDCWTYI